MFIWVELERVHCPADCPVCFITRLLGMAAGTQGSRQSCATSQMTHCPDTCSAAGPVLLAKCQRDLKRFRSHWLSPYVLLLTAEKPPLGCKPDLVILQEQGVSQVFQTLLQAVQTFLGWKWSFIQVQSLWKAVSDSFYVNQPHAEQNKKDVANVKPRQEQIRCLS